MATLARLEREQTTIKIRLESDGSSSLVIATGDLEIAYFTFRPDGSLQLKQMANSMFLDVESLITILGDRVDTLITELSN